jgi:hypothetical protein
LNVPIKINFDHPAEREIEENFVDQDAAKRRQTRRMKITQDRLRKYGYAEGCDGRRCKCAGFRMARAHNPDCRSRVEKAMMEDVVDKEKWEKNVERINRRLAEQVDRNLKENSEGQQGGGKTQEEEVPGVKGETTHDVKADDSVETNERKRVVGQDSPAEVSSGSASSSSATKRHEPATGSSSSSAPEKPRGLDGVGRASQERRHG